MADRYWVGGTAAWDGTAGTKWATTSGGTGGASVPTSVDDVFFTNLSTGTCTISTGNTGAKSINCTGFTGTLAGSAAITVAGSITLVAGMTYTHSGIVTISGTGTLTTAGKTFSSLTIAATGITVTLGDALNLSTIRTLTVTGGTFTTANYNITASAISSSNTNVRAINLGSSTLTLGGTTPIDFSTNTNLTFNAGTSTINTTGTSTIIAGGSVSTTGVTFYNVTPGGSPINIRGINTFNNLSIAGPFVAGVNQVTFDSRQTINGTLSTTGTAGNRRVWFRSNTYGLAQTITINSTPSLTDADFRDLYVIGTAAPISGTRIGNLGGCTGITFSVAKTVYWSQAAGGNWSGNNWATSSGGAVSTDNFPLAQDTAVIENTGLNTSATVTVNTVMNSMAMSGVTMSTRTNAMTLATGTVTPLVYGNWANGSGTTLSGTGTLTFTGRGTQTITSAGKTFTQPLIVDGYGNSVELADALNISANTLTVTSGTFDTKNFNVTAGSITSTNPNVRRISLGSSTLTLSGSSPVVFTQSINLTFNAGTSQINCSSPIAALAPGGMTFYNVSLTSNAITTASILSPTGGSTFNNITITPPSTTGISVVLFNDVANDKINGTLNVAGASPVRRIFIRSDNPGIATTLTVGTLSATDCDFRDITIAGTAAGSSPTRAGNCGGNSGITFPAAKTVYWNLSGAVNWSDTGWAATSGGTPDINQFPLAQDTAVFNNASAMGTVTIDNSWRIGTVDASARTVGAILTTSTNTPFVHGDWKFGTGITSSNVPGTITFAGRGTQTITSNGVTFGCPITVDSVTGVVQLADALTINSARLFTITSGTFDAVSYNVTSGLFLLSGSTARTLKMGSGTWTLGSTGVIWDSATTTNLTFYKNTANIVLSNTSTTARTFAGGGLSYNKLTIGGTSGTSTLTITGNNTFTELASTKVVAHTIALGTTFQTFGKWTVTGTAGNVVTLTGTGTNHQLVGEATSGINYLSMGSIGFSSLSAGEFFAGSNSTGTAGAPVYRIARPAALTLYWSPLTTPRNWSSGEFSTTSGGFTYARVPYSIDDVVLDANSSVNFGGGSYTITIDVAARCNKLTIAGPSSGSVTLAGASTLTCHGNVTLPATGLIRTFTGGLLLSGSTTGKTITTNGVTLGGYVQVQGMGSEWTLGSALNIGTATLYVTYGSLKLSTYNVTAATISCDGTGTRTVDFGSGTVSLSGSTPVQCYSGIGIAENQAANLTVVAGTAQINCSSSIPTFQGIGKTFYNVSFTSTSSGTVTINGANSFNNLSFTGITTAGFKNILISADQTITGTFTCSAGTNATMRHFVQSNTYGTSRSLTCAGVSLTDVDFRDITIAGAATPATGTRLGDCKGNSGITFTAAANKYWNLTGGGTWSTTAWATSSGGTTAANNFPLAQDTCIFENTGLISAGNVTIDAAWNIGTIDLSSRTTAMTLATSSGLRNIHGNLIIGSGVTITSSLGTLVFCGRGSQTITSAGKTFPVYLTINSPGGTVTLQDALAIEWDFNLVRGTFSTGNFNTTVGGTVDLGSSTATRALALGTATMSISGSTFTVPATTGLTLSGTGTINMTSASAKTFAGGSLSYSGITLNQGGVGTLTITGNNTFKTISNSVGTANTIDIGTTTQTITNPLTTSGNINNLLTLTGSSAVSPSNLVFTGVGNAADISNVVINNIRAYPFTSSWNATNSTNNGSLNWTFLVGSAPPPATGNFLLFL
jgi:hypothetical protein